MRCQGHNHTTKQRGYIVDERFGGCQGMNVLVKYEQKVK
jgi:hypothetical protein